MPEQNHPDQTGDQTPEERAEQQRPEPQQAPEPSAPDAPDTEPASTPGAPPAPPAAEQRTGAGGRRVTRRTVDRSEVTEHTVETITEEIPPEYYQGPASAHPAPVG